MDFLLDNNSLDIVLCVETQWWTKVHWTTIKLLILIVDYWKLNSCQWLLRAIWFDVDVNEEFESFTLHCSMERIIIIMVAVVPHIAESVMITNVVANCRTFHWTGALDVQWNGLVFSIRTVNQAATIADCKSAPNWVRWFESITLHWCKALHRMDSCSYCSDLLSIKDCM